MNYSKIRIVSLPQLNFRSLSLHLYLPSPFADKGRLHGLKKSMSGKSLTVSE